MKQSRNSGSAVCGRLAILVAGLALVAFLASCSTGYNIPLNHRNVTPSAEKAKQVAIGDVVNARDAKKGGKNNVQIGLLRGGYGNPFPLDTKGKVEITQYLKDLMNDAARECGLDVVNSGSAPVLAMDINTFWCDGYSGIYKAFFELDLKLMSADGKTVKASKVIKFDDGFSYMYVLAEISGAYKRFMNRILDEVESALKSDEFRSAL